MTTPMTILYNLTPLLPATSSWLTAHSSGEDSVVVFGNGEVVRLTTKSIYINHQTCHEHSAGDIAWSGRFEHLATTHTIIPITPSHPIQCICTIKRRLRKTHITVQQLGYLPQRNIACR
jgi:hypothetical protein